MNQNNKSFPPAAGQAAHTPTPWLAVDDGQSWPHVHADFVPHGAVCIMADFDPEMEGNGKRSIARAKANADFIVCACNSHAALVAFLEAFESANVNTPDTVKDASLLHSFARGARASLTP